MLYEVITFNPMLGHRGCRLGITYPEITEMQARAIAQAAVQVSKKGVKVIPEVARPPQRRAGLIGERALVVESYNFV